MVNANVQVEVKLTTETKAYLIILSVITVLLLKKKGALVWIHF